MAHVRSDEGSAMIESLWPRATWAINASPTEKPVGADELHGVLPDRQVLKGAFPAQRTWKGCPADGVSSGIRG